MMWYSGATKGPRAYALGLADSPDGKAFEKHAGNPVMRMEDSHRSIVTAATLRKLDGTLIREKGKIRLWFSTTDFVNAKPGVYPLHTLHESESVNGRTWSKPSPALLQNAYGPSVLKEGGVYRLWYADLAGESWTIRHAVSGNGKDWKVTAEPVLELDQRWERKNLFYPTVVKADGVYLMWYGSYWNGNADKTALGMAASLDGLTWYKNPHNPVFTPDEARPWESHYTTSESVVRLADGSWRIWYASRTKPPHENKYFALCTARWSGPPKAK
jgi:hypothetical protein